MSKPVPDLMTNRLKLSTFKETDIPSIVSLANNYEVAKNLGRMPFPYLVKDAEFFLDKIVTTELTWKISLLDTSEMIGTIGLRPIVKDEVSELGFWYGQEFWGNGYATEAANAVIDLAFKELALLKIEAGHFLVNEASGHVLKKVGFTQTGTSLRDCMAQNKKLSHAELELKSINFVSPPAHSK